MEKPQIILLDEPINALDESGITLIKELLLKLSDNSIIIISCHDREELEYLSDEVFVMSEGRIIEHRIVGL